MSRTKIQGCRRREQDLEISTGCLYQLAELGTVYQKEFETSFLQRRNCLLFTVSLIFGNSWSCSAGPAGPLASPLITTSFVSLQRKNMILTLPVLTKEMRPLPRKPDYLRDSFDLGQFLDSSGNGEPVEALSKFPDESNPRQPPPQPASPNVPCLQRKGDSILLAISSEEDSQRKRGSKIKKPAYASQGCGITQALLPPSSFKKTLDDNRTGIQYRNPKRGAVVSDGIHTSELSETEESILDTGQQYQGSSTEESSSESGDSGQEESSKCPENEEIYKEVTRMRDILRDYQKQQKRLRELEERQSHILQWINLEIELHKDGTFEGDDDFLQATQLNVEILSDIQKVTEHISERKPMVKKLAKDIQVLLQKLNV